MLRKLSNIKKSSSNSIYPLHVNLIKNTATILNSTILKIYDKTIENSTYPEILKTTILLPIFKKGNRSDISNYRPIALLNWLSKTYENILHNQLNYYLQNNKIINENHNGFQSKKSTKDAIFHILVKIQESLLKGKQVCAIFIDLQKAFDTINHNILLRKLQLIGLKGGDLKLMHSYLKDR